MELQKDKTKELSESTTDHLTHLTSEVFHSSDCKDHSSIKKYDPATYTYFASKRSLSRDETVGSVLKDYFTIQAENETASNKPKKSVISQALLPKSKRSVSLVSETCSSSMPFTSTLNVLTSSVDTVAPASVTRLLSLDQVKQNTDDNASLSSFIKKTEEDAIKTVGYKNYLECKTAHKEQNKSTKINSFGSEQSSSDKLNFNTASESSNIGSTGNLYQLSKESSDKMAFEDAETEYTRNVSSSKAFFESITDPSNKSLTMNVRRSSDSRNKRRNHSNAYGEQENGILAKFGSEKSSCLELKTTNMADESTLEPFYKPKTIYNPISKLPTTGLSSLASDELWLKTDKNCITSDFERNPGSKLSAESTSISKSGSKFTNENILKETENQKCVWLLENVYSKRITKNATESDAIIDSDRISMPQNKSLLKSKENSRKFDNTGMQILATTPIELTSIVKPGLGKNLSDKSTTAVNEFDCSGASICMQDHEYSSNCEGDLLNVNETTAYFESLKSSTYSLLPGQKDLISCKLNAAAQEAIGKGDITGKSVEFFSDSSILPDTCSAQSQNQPVFQRNSTKSTSAQTFGRHSSLPLQKYLPVSEKKLSKPKPAANFMVSSQTSQRMVDSNSKQKKQSLLMPNSSETPSDQKHLKTGKELSLRESETSQNTVESLASKYTTLLPSQTSFHDERKQDPSVLAKHTNADHTRFQPNNVYGKAPLVKDAGKHTFIYIEGFISIVFNTPTELYISIQT